MCYTDRGFFRASYTNPFVLINELEHSDFDHYIKTLTLDSPIGKYILFLTNQHCNRNAVASKFHNKKENFCIGSKQELSKDKT